MKTTYLKEHTNEVGIFEIRFGDLNEIFRGDWDQVDEYINENNLEEMDYVVKDFRDIEIY